VADVAIHGHLGAGSAGIESALAGIPTVMLDLEGNSASPLWGSAPSYSSWESLWNGLRNHVGWNLDVFDPFRDGQAASRMGTFLENIHVGLKRGGSPERVIDTAVEQYAYKWGEDKVIPG
jgi:hypothetical protein